MTTFRRAAGHLPTVRLLVKRTLQDGWRRDGYRPRRLIGSGLWEVRASVRAALGAEHEIGLDMRNCT